MRARAVAKATANKGIISAYVSKKGMKIGKQSKSNKSKGKYLWIRQQLRES
jgi:hypothetical protein